MPFWGRVLSEIHIFFYPFSGTPTRIMDWMVRPINMSTITCPTSWRGALPEFRQTIEDCLCNLNCTLIWEQEREKHKVVQEINYYPYRWNLVSHTSRCANSTISDNQKKNLLYQMFRNKLCILFSVCANILFKYVLTWWQLANYVKNNILSNAKVILYCLKKIKF